MLSREVLIMKLREFTTNFQIDISKDEKTTAEFFKYIDFVEKHLNNKQITDRDFVNAVDKIISTTTTTFNKMPNVAMFLEHIPSAKPLAIEDISKARANELYSFLIKYSWWATGSHEYVWDYIPFDHKFDDEAINIMVDGHYGGMKNLARELKRRMESGDKWLEKELIELFKTQDLVAQKNTIAISAEKKEKAIELVSNLSSNLKINKE